jgi:hypothetical protein
MAWIVPGTSDVQNRTTPDEWAKISLYQGGSTLAAILTTAVMKIRDAIQAGGYDLDPDPTKIPAGLLADCVSIVVFLGFSSIPGCTSFITDPRKDLNQEAVDKLKLISAQKWAPESPWGSGRERTGNWNAENKLIGRMHPVPPPESQFPTDMGNVPDPYANPRAPQDGQGQGCIPGPSTPPAIVDLPDIDIAGAVNQALFANTGFTQLSAQIVAAAGNYTAAFTLPAAGVLPGALVFLNVDLGIGATVNIYDGSSNTLLQTVVFPGANAVEYFAGCFVFGQDNRWHKKFGAWQQ